MPKKFIEVEDRNGGIVVVRFTQKRIVHDDNNQVGEQLSILGQAHERILMDLGALDLTDSAFLGRMLTLNKTVRALDGKLVLFNVPVYFREYLRVTQLESYFRI